MEYYSDFCLPENILYEKFNHKKQTIAGKLTLIPERNLRHIDHFACPAYLIF